MSVTIKELQDEILNFSGNQDDIFYQLTHAAHSMLLELEAHKGRKIQLGHNSFAPLNEEKYTLVDYQLFRVLSGNYTKSILYTLVITVKDDDGKELSYCYDQITNISDNLINPTTLKFHITVNNRMLDHLRHDSKFPRELLKEDKTLLDNYGFSVYRFFLYD